VEEEGERALPWPWGGEVGARIFRRGRSRGVSPRKIRKDHTGTPLSGGGGDTKGEKKDDGRSWLAP